MCDVCVMYCWPRTQAFHGVFFYAAVAKKNCLKGLGMACIGASLVLPCHGYGMEGRGMAWKAGVWHGRPGYGMEGRGTSIIRVYTNLVTCQ